MKTKLLLWLCGGILCAASPVLALEMDQCGPAANMRATLAAEGQNTIIIGNRSGAGIPTALAFTSNADGSKGYMVVTDLPLGEKAGWVCVQSVYRDIRIGDVTKPGIPTWALHVEDTARVDEQCAGQKLGWQGACHLHSTALKNLESHGQRVLFKAIGTAKSRGSVRDDQLLLVTVDSRESAGILTATTDEGANYMLWAYSKVAITPYAEPLKR
ncbi:hypothetical protein [Caulobacter soli]|uniref:hypothetical protein n=1 Tax=Caulobacter soli TaxID=2708539 RepID=UPI0013EAB35C|nr:hypothetical protein [Caulobacter soli]